MFSVKVDKKVDILDPHKDDILAYIITGQKVYSYLFAGLYFGNFKLKRHFL